MFCCIFFLIWWYVCMKLFNNYCGVVFPHLSPSLHLNLFRRHAKLLIMLPHKSVETFPSSKLNSNQKHNEFSIHKFGGFYHRIRQFNNLFHCMTQNIWLWFGKVITQTETSEGETVVSDNTKDHPEHLAILHGLWNSTSSNLRGSLCAGESDMPL